MSLLRALLRSLPLPIRLQLGHLRALTARAIYTVTGSAPSWVKHADLREYWDHREMLCEEQQTGAHTSQPVIEGRAIFFEALAREPFRLILDAGCGYGRELKPMAARFPETKTIGVDYSFKQLQDAKHFAPGAAGRLVQASLTALPFRDGAFDATCSHSVLSMMPESAAPSAFDELTRVTSGRILHREVVRDHLLRAGRKALVKALDLTAHCFSHDYENEYRKRGCDVLVSEPLAPYRDQPPDDHEELWYSLIVVRPGPHR